MVLGEAFSERVQREWRCAEELQQLHGMLTRNSMLGDADRRKYKRRQCCEKLSIAGSDEQVTIIDKSAKGIGILSKKDLSQGETIHVERASEKSFKGIIVNGTNRYGVDLD